MESLTVKHTDRITFTLDSSLRYNYPCLPGKYDTIYLEKPAALDQDLWVYVDGGAKPIANLKYTKVVKTHFFSRVTFIWDTASGIEVQIVFGNPESFLPTPQILGSVGLRDTSDNAINPATEDTLSALNNKIQSQSADLFVKDVSVGTTAVQADTDSTYRDAVTILADSGNTDTVYVGNASSQTFPLAAGAAITIRKTALNLIYLLAASGTQTVHIIAGGA